MVAKKRASTNKKGEKVYGPYAGSDANGKDRKTYVHRRADGTTYSVNAAREEYQKKTGKTLPKSTHVDHKDNNRGNDAPSNHRAMSASKNIGKGNQHRKKK